MLHVVHWLTLTSACEDTSENRTELAHDHSRHNIPVNQRSAAEFEVPRLCTGIRPWKPVATRLVACNQFCQWSRASLALEICGKSYARAVELILLMI